MDSQVVESVKSDTGKSLTKSYIVCFACALFFFYEFIQMQMFNAINDSLRTAFHINAAQLSFLSSTFLWGDLLFLLPAGIILDRFSTRKMVIFSMVLSIVSTIGFAITSHFWLAAFCHFLTGIGNAFCFLACVILVARWFPSYKQAMVIGMVITIAFLGGMAAQTPLVSMAEMLGWRKALLGDALLGVFILGIIYAFVEDSPKTYTYQNNSGANSLMCELKQVMKNPQNYLGGLYTSLLNLPIMVLCALWGTDALITIHGVSKLQASSIVSMIFVGSIIGCPLAGWISDNWGYRRHPMIIGAFLSLIAVGFLMVDHQMSVFSLSVIFFLLGFFTSTQVVAYPLVAESNSEKLTGTATALASILIMGGAGVAQMLFGELLDFHWQNTFLDGHRVYTAGDYHFAMQLFPISLLIALAASVISKETYCKRSEHLYK